MAEWTVLQLEVLQLLVQGLVLADFAGVVLFLKDALTTCDAGAEVSATLAARGVVLVDEVATLRAVVLLLLLVMRRVAREKVDGQELVGLSLLSRNRI